MAVTIRKKNGLIIPKTPSLLIPGSIFGSLNSKKDTYEEIVEQEIGKIIKEYLNLSRLTSVRRIEFFPIYKSRNGEKEINKIFMKYRTRQTSVILTVDLIEDRGVTLLEFFDYMITRGAKEMQNPEIALSEM